MKKYFVTGPNLSYTIYMTLLFVFFKIFGMTDADWIWVVAPLWVPWIMLFLTYCIISIIACIKEIKLINGQKSDT